MLSRQRNSNIGQYRSISVISGTLFFQNHGLRLFTITHPFIAMYGYKRLRIIACRNIVIIRKTFRNDRFFTILDDVAIFRRENIKRNIIFIKKEFIRDKPFLAVAG
jgi:hypothetical protein